MCHFGVIHHRVGGCNGYSYTMNYATQSDVESKKFDIVDSHNIKVLVDPMAIFYILGTEMDYEVETRCVAFRANM